jgi:hypothetical protein
MACQGAVGELWERYSNVISIGICLLHWLPVYRLDSWLRSIARVVGHGRYPAMQGDGMCECVSLMGFGRYKFAICWVFLVQLERSEGPVAHLRGF